jgi:hypothetical protein
MVRHLYTVSRDALHTVLDGVRSASSKRFDKKAKDAPARMSTALMRQFDGDGLGRPPGTQPATTAERTRLCT